MCNSATERSAHDEATRNIVDSYVDRISAAFTNALRNALNRGDIKSDINLEEEGSYFTTTILGFFVLLRSQTGDKVIKPAMSRALRHLNELKISQSNNFYMSNEEEKISKIKPQTECKRLTLKIIRKK